MSNPYLAVLVNHLWQSTLFAAAIWGLSRLLRRNSPRVRYFLWLAASLKFLLPFAVVAAIGAQIPWHPEPGSAGAATTQIMEVAGDITAPLTGEMRYPQLPVSDEVRSARRIDELATISVLVIWLTGALFVWARWLVRWIGIRCVVRRSVSISGIEFPAPVRVTEKKFEPGVVGVLRPLLLLPAGIEERLTPEQMRAVLAHERCHLRWRDNLTASMHMFVETVLWFFPPVWWIGARLIEERERACDEQVVRDGHNPGSYAEGILGVCEHYIASRLPCVSGVSGADLRKRIESIVRRTLSMKLDGKKKLVLATIGCCAIAAPITGGMIAGNSWQALLSLAPSGAATLEYFRVGIASVDMASHEIQTDGKRRNTLCPRPGADLAGKQKDLAALVAKLSAQDDKALMYAIAANSTVDVKRLLSGGAIRRGDGFLRPSAPMHLAVEFGDAPMLELLQNEGFSIDEVSTDGIGTGETPLMFALGRGRLENARWLIEHGADVNFANKYGNSALVHALVTCRDHNQAALLLRAGAKPDFKALRIADNLGIDLRTDADIAGHKPGPPLQSWRIPAESSLPADLDGDGAVDAAALHVSADDKSKGVFVELSSRDSGKWTKAAASSPLMTPADTAQMRITVAKPGTYTTGCGSRNNCAAGRPATITLTQPGIDFFRPEGPHCIAYWDKPTSMFKCVDVMTGKR